MLAAELFEAGMLAAFGMAWPVAIWKTWRSKRTEGMSVLFMAIVLVGYLSGIVARFIRAATASTDPGWVTVLYGLNAALVVVEIGLVLYYQRRRPAGAEVA